MCDWGLPPCNRKEEKGKGREKPDHQVLHAAARTPSHPPAACNANVAPPPPPPPITMLAGWRRRRRRKCFSENPTKESAAAIITIRADDDEDRTAVCPHIHPHPPYCTRFSPFNSGRRRPPAVSQRAWEEGRTRSLGRRRRASDDGQGTANTTSRNNNSIIVVSHLQHLSQRCPSGAS